MLYSTLLSSLYSTLYTLLYSTQWNCSLAASFFVASILLYTCWFGPRWLVGDTLPRTPTHALTTCRHKAVECVIDLDSDATVAIVKYGEARQGKTR